MRILSLILIFISYCSFGQTPVPCFTVDNISGCVPHTINVTNCSGSTNLPQYVYGSGNTAIVDSSFEFIEAGAYLVFQIFDDGSGGFVKDSQIVTVKPTPNPEFQLYNCGNYEVYIEIPNLGYDDYNVNWGDGNLDTFNGGLNSTHIYLDSISKTIILEGLHVNENCGNDTSISITPFQNFRKSKIDTLEVLDDNSIVLHIFGQQQVLYDIEMFTNGVSTSTHQINASSTNFTDTIRGLNTLNNTYCFVISAFNKCSNSTVNASISDKVCSIIITANSQEGFNDITWDTYTGDNSPIYYLFRNNESHKVFTTNQNPYSDSSIFCNQEYIYQLYISAGSSVSISNLANAIGKSESEPNAVTEVYSTFNNFNQLVISWKSASKIPPKFYSINSTQTSDTFLISESIEQTCYEITYTDSCGNTSKISKETCPIILNAKQNNIFEIELNWNNYTSFENGMNNYEITIYDNLKNLVSTINNDLTTDYLFDVFGENIQIYYFRIKGISNDSLSTLSNEVMLELNNRVIVPNAFSPNGDGQNDIFKPKVRFIKEFNFAIYNKWGASLFVSDDANVGWDGGDAPSGVYTYVIEVTDYLDKKTVKNGTVTLIR